jgi:two-component system, response regulator
MEEKIILLVEDNPDDVALTLRAFEKSRIKNRIVVAEDGVEALDYIFRRGKFENRELKELPALVLLDIKLPKIDGFEVLKAIRDNEFTKLLPVVILTSSKEEQDIIKGYKNGANSYIRKPVDFDKFFEAVQTLGLYWLILNEPPIINGKI